MIVLSASVFARVGTLLWAAAFGRALPHDVYVQILYAVGVSLAVQVMLDLSSLTTYFLRTNGEYEGRSLWDRGVQVGSVVSVLIVVATCAASVLGAGTRSEVAMAIASIAALAASEGFARYLRWVWQANAHFGRYAFVDVAIGMERFCIAAAVYWTGSVGVLIGASLTAAAVLLIPTMLASRRNANTLWTSGGQVGLGALIRESWPYALSITASSSYSQLPTVLVGLRASVSQGALYTGVTRVTQPTELIPGSIANVALPSLISQPLARRKIATVQIAAALAAGVAVAIAAVATVPEISRFLVLPEAQVSAILVILVLDLPIKYVNYQLVALAVAQGRIKARLAATCVVAALTAVTLWFTTPYGGRAAAITAVAADGLLLLALVGLQFAPRRSRAPTPRN
ncbi:hypothetical protein ACXR2U_08740 [Jatrophihabitans sp. YIM 134969]